MQGKKENLLYVLTNVPASGKTTIAESIKRVSEGLGSNVHYINEFGIIGNWFTANIDKEHLIKREWADGDTENGHLALSSEGYEELFQYTAGEIIREFNEYSSVARTIITEAARNVGGVSYLPLFSDLVEAIGEQTHLVNLNIVVNDQNKLRERAQMRLKKSPNSAPLSVLETYLKEAPLHPSSVEIASQFSDNFIYNDDFDNNGTPEQAEMNVKGIVRHILVSTGSIRQ